MEYKVTISSLGNKAKKTKRKEEISILLNYQQHPHRKYFSSQKKCGRILPHPT
jgi:hypothetical protein